MKFNAKKCYTMRIHRSKHPISHTYTLGEEELCVVPSQAYLHVGVEVQERLSWKTHIQAVASKASRTLGFLRRNLGKYSPNIKQLAYISLVRYQLEYASVIWDPHEQNQIDQLEKDTKKSCPFRVRKLHPRCQCYNYERTDWSTHARGKKKKSSPNNVLQNYQPHCNTRTRLHKAEN